MSQHCGSERGYKAHRRAGEDTCTACREAHASYQRGGQPAVVGAGRSRSLAVVAASLPTFCACGGERRMALVALNGMRGAGVVLCPHCAGDPRDSIEIRTYRMRVDAPRHHHEDEIA